MKKNKFQTALFSMVILLSLFSYAFLSTVKTPSTTIDSLLGIENMEVDKLHSNETLMPDVKIVKTAVELLKSMIPISQ
jgi:hypothetical protein